MEISSPVFKNGESLPKKYTCEGENVNPPLNFSNVPASAESLVLIVEDPDAMAKPWVHWLVFNIPPGTEKFEEGALAEYAVEGLCNGNTFGYEGPCPPEGLHHYYFYLYALDIKLHISPATDRKAILPVMKGHVLAEAQLMGVYERENVKHSKHR